jgi:arylsulfatase A-like enzyme
MLPVFEAFLDDVRADARGTFSWVHLIVPHAPYVFDARGAIHPLDYRAYWADQTEYRRALTAYRRQVGFVDRLLGRFLDRLQAEGLVEDAIVIVTSDHGFHSLHPFGRPELIDGFEASAARPRVPLIVRAPGVRPGVVADDYQHFDFKRLVLGLIDGAGVPPAAVARQKRFCDNATWYIRDAGGRWTPQVGADGRPRTCTSAGVPHTDEDVTGPRATKNPGGDRSAVR